MQHIIITCNNCSQKIGIPSRMHFFFSKCPSCNKKLVWRPRKSDHNNVVENNDDDSIHYFTLTKNKKRKADKKNYQPIDNLMQKTKTKIPNKKLNKKITTEESNKKQEKIDLNTRESKIITAIEIKKALKDTDMIRNKEVSDYLRKNPIKDEIGKFGVPQDKYRWGFYGHIPSAIEFSVSIFFTIT